MDVLVHIVVVEERGFWPNDEVLNVGLHVDHHAYCCLIHHLWSN